MNPAIFDEGQTQFFHATDAALKIEIPETVTLCAQARQIRLRPSSHAKKPPNDGQDNP
jgi:hypothetical protein